MSEPVWLPESLVLAIHGEQLAIFGGGSGVRDLGLLQSALDRPRNKWGYGEVELPVLAAAYGFGLAKNHPFVDGNKRVAFLSMFTFLGLNGLDLIASEPEATVIMQALASGQLTEAELAVWVGQHSVAAGS
jgi:death on curing protein